MSEVDQIWAELHDLEERVGRLEQTDAANHAVAEEKIVHAEHTRDLLLKGIPIVVSLASVIIMVIALILTH